MATPLTPPPKEFFRQFANLAHNRVLTEDFPHEKLLTLKYKGTGSAFVVNAKGSINVKTDKKTVEVTKEDGKKEEKVEYTDTYPTSSEVKFLTGYNNTTTEARFNNKGFVKVHTNWGVHNVGEPVEVVSVVKGDTAFKKTKAWVGAYYAKGSIGVASRLQARRTKGFAFSLAEKVTYSHKDLWAGAYVDFNLTDLKLSQYNAVVGYNVNKNIHFYAEHITSKSCCTPKPVVAATTTPAATETKTEVIATEKTTVTESASGVKTVEKTATVEVKKEDATPLLKKIGFGKGALTGVYKDANIFALAQVAWEEPTETFTFDAGAVYTINGTSSVRAKINQNFDLAIGGRHKINKNVSLNVGTSIPLRNPEKFYDADKTVPIPFGSTLEFNF